MDFIINVLEQGLIFGIMALGVYITYKILDFPDLSVDGSFPLGGAVVALLLSLGINPILATISSLFAGMVAGFATGYINVKLKITNLLSGILVMISLYSINLRIMGKSNIPLFNYKTIFSNNVKPVIIVFIFAIIIKILIDVMLKTKFGFILRVAGDNPQLVNSLGVDIGYIKILGLMLSNGLVALSGAIMAQYQGFSDAGMGTGIIVMGLASVIFGETVFKRYSWIVPTSMVLLGSILYKISIAFALKMGLAPTDLKLITALILVVIMGLNEKRFVFKRSFSIGGGKVAENTKFI